MTAAPSSAFTGSSVELDLFTGRAEAVPECIRDTLIPVEALLDRLRSDTTERDDARLLATIQRGTRIEDLDALDKYRIGTTLRFEGHCPDEPYDSKFAPGDLLVVGEANGGGFGIMCVRTADGHQDQAWPCEVSIFNPNQLGLFERAARASRSSTYPTTKQPP